MIEFEPEEGTYLPQFLTYTPIYRMFLGFIPVLERVEVKRDVLATIQYQIENGLESRAFNIEDYKGEHHE